MQIEHRPLSSIKPYEKNPRHNDSAVAAVANSIREFGFRQPLVIDKDNVIVVGHTRWRAAHELGLTEVPVHVALDLSPEKAKAYRIADNRLATIATFDMELLPIELAELKALDIDLSLLGFSADELAEIMAPPANEGLTDPDDIPEPPPTPITEPGDLWLLGEHRLLCADSTDPLQVRRLMNGVRAALFQTDPPYLVNYDGTNHFTSNKATQAARKHARAAKKNGLAEGAKDWSASYGTTWDDADANSDLYEKFIRVAIDEAIEPDAPWYCWHASRRQAMLEAEWIKAGAFAHQQIIWVKNRPILTRSFYTWQHEPCLMGWIKGNQPKRMPEVRMMSSVWEADVPGSGSGQATETAERPDHPTPKPVVLFETPIVQHTRPGEVCYEPFAGSGTQIIAAERTGRRCFAGEVSPVYVDLIVNRWQLFSGREAQRFGADGKAKPGLAQITTPEKTPAAVTAGANPKVTK